MNETNKSLPSSDLKLAREITDIVNHEWESGTFLKKVTNTTKDLLNFWFSESFSSSRLFNFHSGQRQAILNVIYCYEVLNLQDNLNSPSEAFSECAATQLKSNKHNFPKYAIKMATGTGKTWVMHALLLWEYLNALEDTDNRLLFSKKFLLLAPGNIVYERLLDAYLGKESVDHVRDFETCDFKKFESLFIPEMYREQVYNFLQNSICVKEDIGSKITGDSLIAITNWHLLMGENNEEDDFNPAKIVKDLLPIQPGKTEGNSLSSLDSNFLAGKALDFLIGLDDIVIINDEAHHIHEKSINGEVFEVEWQQAITKIAQRKKSVLQIDFSATPYTTTGGKKTKKNYFPHIIVDFDLRQAINHGLVKTIVIDKRKELASQHLEDLDYKAVREGNTVISLSEGQKVMLRAGLQKLALLEKDFVDFTKDVTGTSNKHPKMLVMCEDTSVCPFVSNYLISECGLTSNDVIEINSNKQGEVKDSEWREIKQKLFNIDNYASPKVVVSVLMLREGFDVNNVCVIVPLRSSSSNILLEQTVGRGLRLMWREPEYQEIKAENRYRLLQKKEAPSNYIDILSIIEHPKFIDFYNDLVDDNLAGEDSGLPEGSSVGDLINVPLKQNFKDYDMYYPVILHDSEEILVHKEIDINTFEPYTVYSLDKLRAMVKTRGTGFYSEELTVKTRFGTYPVDQDLFNAKSYNEYLTKIINSVSMSLERVGTRKTKKFPFMQVNAFQLIGTIDLYIRTKMFNQTFNPFENEDWRVLLLSQTNIVKHIITQLSTAIYELQNNTTTTTSVVEKKHFSQLPTLKMRSSYAIDVAKSIYPKLSYPSHKGGLEREFILFCDRDSEVNSIIKIIENKHFFTSLSYIRTDGLIASYFPDFIVRIDKNIYIVETKAQKDLTNPNVKNKENAAFLAMQKINKLPASDRMDCLWNYVLLGEDLFYSYKHNGSTVKEMLEFAKLTSYKLDGTIFSLID